MRDRKGKRRGEGPCLEMQDFVAEASKSSYARSGVESMISF
jgi:hypothetical protein